MDFAKPLISKLADDGQWLTLTTAGIHDANNAQHQPAEFHRDEQRNADADKTERETNQTAGNGTDIKRQRLFRVVQGVGVILLRDGDIKECIIV